MCPCASTSPGRTHLPDASILRLRPATDRTAARVRSRLPAACTTPLASTTTPSSRTRPVFGSTSVPPSTTSGCGTGLRRYAGTSRAASPACAAGAPATPAVTPAVTPARTAAPASALRRVTAAGGEADVALWSCRHMGLSEWYRRFVPFGPGVSATVGTNWYTKLVYQIGSRRGNGYWREGFRADPGHGARGDPVT